MRLASMSHPKLFILKWQRCALPVWAVSHIQGKVERKRTRLRSHCNRVSSLLSSAIRVSRSPQWCCRSSSVSYQGKKSRTLEMNSYIDFHINATCFLSCSSLLSFFFKYYFFKYYFWWLRITVKHLWYKFEVSDTLNKMEIQVRWRYSIKRYCPLKGTSIIRSQTVIFPSGLLF